MPIVAQALGKTSDIRLESTPRGGLRRSIDFAAPLATYELALDTNPSLGTRFIAFDPIRGGNPGAGGLVIWDNVPDDNGTGSGGGTSFVGREANYAAGLAANDVAQKSWKAHWFFDPGFDPTVDSTYDITLTAVDGGRTVARTAIQIIVGAGGAAEAPEPATFGRAALGLLGEARRRRD
ncbi:MAG: hypothetical protein AB7Q81_03795 [Gammaproteobacteria bacterium]